MSGTRKTPTSSEKSPSKTPPPILPTDEEIAAGRRAGELRRRNEVSVSGATVDAAARWMTLSLASGAEVRVDLRKLPELEGATPKQRRHFSLRDSGRMLVWEDLDVHISAMGLFIDLLGKAAVRRELNRQLAASKSPARTAASQANGRLGGRPLKSQAKQTAT